MSSKNLRLLSALKDENPEAIKKLIEEDESLLFHPVTEDDDGNTLLHHLCERGGADADKDGFEEKAKLIFTHLVPGEHGAFIESLIRRERRQILKVKNKAGFTPLHLAARQRNPELLKAMLHYWNKGEKMEVVDRDGNTLFHFAAACNSDNAIECVEALLEAGCDVNATNSKNETALWKAMESGANHQMVSFLLSKSKSNPQNQVGGTEEHGCRYKDNEGQTALNSAASGGSSKVVKEAETSKEKRYTLKKTWRESLLQHAQNRAAAAASHTVQKPRTTIQREEEIDNLPAELQQYFLGERAARRLDHHSLHPVRQRDARPERRDDVNYGLAYEQQTFVPSVLGLGLDFSCLM